MIRNWAGNVAFSSARFHQPTSVEQVQEIVAAAEHVRVLGSGHSFSPIADTTGDLLSLTALPQLLGIADNAVTISAGTRYGELVGPVHAAGLALPNTGSLPHIMVAGASATGTHGSGNGNRVLASSISALDVVGADGELRTVRRGDPGFAGAAIALGSLGVVTQLTLDLVPTYDVRQTVVEGLRSFDDAPEALASAYSVSLFTYFQGEGFEQVWVKQRAEEPPVAAGWLGTTPADGPRHMVRGVDPVSCTPQLGSTGPWFTRLPHFRLDFTPSKGDELQSEYLVPRGSVVAALHALDAIRDRIAPVLHVAEVRTIAADDQWLSAAQGRDSAALHFTWISDVAAVLPVVGAVEEVLSAFDARPHWGKVFTTPAERIAKLWPHLPDFVAAARAADPGGKFRNAFLNRHVFV
jgi:alditol oxidase